MQYIQAVLENLLVERAAAYSSFRRLLIILIRSKTTNGMVVCIENNPLFSVSWEPESRTLLLNDP
jgi:hypothetical protein